MRIKNLMGSVRSGLGKLDSFTLERSKNHLIRTFLRNGRLRVNFIKFVYFYYRKPILNTLLPIAIFAPTEKIPLQTDDNKNKFSIENVVTNFCSIVYSLNLLDVS